MKAHGTRIMHPLYSLPTSCSHWPLQKKQNHHWIPGFVISWLLKVYNCEESRVSIRTALKGCCCGFIGCNNKMDFKMLPLRALCGSWTVSRFNYNSDFLS